MYRKKPKLNHVNEQDETVETVQIIDTDIVVRESKAPTVSEETHQPSTSNTQIIQRQLSIEVSSSRKPVDKGCPKDDKSRMALSVQLLDVDWKSV